MAALFFLLSLAYAFASSGLACYSLFGLCVWPLAATPGFAAGKLILLTLFLLCAGSVGVLFGSMAVQAGGLGGWHEMFSSGQARDSVALLSAVLLPFCLCWGMVRRHLVAVCGVSWVCLFCYGRVFWSACAGA